ncbi:MAG: hypothetical protein ABIR13_03545 [Polaromonas sp.]
MNRHNAPPVAYPLGRPVFLRHLLLGLWLAGLLCVLLWIASARQQPGAVVLALVAVLGAGMALWVSWKNLQCGQLTWDGDIWYWESMGCQECNALHELSVVADLQSRLLLRFEGQPGKGLWLWAEQASLPERWLDLRRAVFAPHKSAPGKLQHDKTDAVDVMDAMDPMKAQATSFSPALLASASSGAVGGAGPGVHAAQGRS